ncbi:MAG: helix-turn-helix transcriptional regulator [Candidatus Thiodiazotropha sp.]
MKPARSNQRPDRGSSALGLLQNDRTTLRLRVFFSIFRLNLISNPKFTFVKAEVQLQYDVIFGRNHMNQLKISFGKRLQQLRSEYGITQEQLANVVDLTVESISNIERGVYGPKFDTLEKIAVALQVPVKKLFEFDGT